MQFGLGAYRGLNEFLDLLHLMVTKEDLDCLIGVSGFKGYGKSTFGIGSSKRIVEKQLKQPFKLKNYSAYSVYDVQRLAEELEPFSPLNCDEAVNFAMGEDWMKSENKDTKKMFAKIRTKHLIFFFCIPDLWWLDKKYREGMMTVWIHILKKGYVLMALPNLVPGLEDRWHRSWLQKTFRKTHWHFFSDIKTLMSRLRKYPCYFDEFAFPKLPAPLYQQHLKLRDAQVFETIPGTKGLGDRLIAYLPAFNAYNRFKELRELVNNGKDKISYKAVTNFFYFNPLSEAAAVNEITIRSWIKKVRERLDKAAIAKTLMESN